MASRTFTVVESASAAARVDAALAFLRALPPTQPVTIVAATREAADDLARQIAIERGATIGLSRFSLTQLAARLAAVSLAGRGVAAATALGTEAVAARVAFDAAGAGSLRYFGSVASTPGFPRALAHTMRDVRGAGVETARLAHAGIAGTDLEHLLGTAERELDTAATADRAALFDAARIAVAQSAEVSGPLVLLDVPLDVPGEAAFVTALAARASAVLATVPSHDVAALNALTGAGAQIARVGDVGDSLLARLRRHLFADDAPAPREADDTLQFFSAPGEGRESVEIARRLLAEARRGVRFDEMAILLRAPHQYHGLLEHAMERAGVPAWFGRGTRRPHPAGRAFLALLACAAEGLSARRFAEYLSLGQVPSVASEEESWDVPTPRHWEHLIVEASVIGGDAGRWRRRLDGLDAELERRQREAERQERTSQADGIARDRDRLRQLASFALPLVIDMAEWPAAATWRDWLDRFDELAPRVLRVPQYVAGVLADLRPMASVGPVTLDEVRGVLADRLRLVEAEPPARRYGRVFVGTPQQARGRRFRVVFVPGLAERMFPQKPRQDPLLGDAARARVDAALPTRADQGRSERLLLHIAIGAATDRLYVSYPRLEVAEGRGRVPSFYALDVLRGATGTIPDHEALAAAAAASGDPSLAWPAPADPGAAIDDQEHDLSVLRSLLDVRDPQAVRGHAHYILKLNPALRRSVTDRWARGERRWTQFDGITRVTDAIRPALAENRLAARRYSLSALQRFAACPYQFLLGAIYRLQPMEMPQPLQRLDPLTKGSLVHAIQAEFFRRLQRTGHLPVTRDSADAALHVLAESVTAVSAEYEETLVPAIRRVWADEIAAIARDLRGWVRHNAEAGGGWVPKYFELAFGLPDDIGRDPSSAEAPVTIDGRFILRGSVDLVEEDPETGTLRVTDHKTGKDRHKDTLVIGGGEVLQPVLYSAAVEAVTGRPVTESRLYFCTSAGGFKVRPVRLTPEARRAGLEALEIIDRAVERGTLAAAPKDGACQWCDFRQVCGPNEEERIRRKPKDLFADLIELRGRP